MQASKVIIIGAGIAGIASAIRLAARGFQVSVFEKNDYPGGKLSEISRHGYRFDAGPSLFTLPHLVKELFELGYAHSEDHFRYEKLENICRYHYEDGTIINAWQDPEKFGEEIQVKTLENKTALLKFLDKSKNLYELTNEVFIFNSFHKASTFLSKAFIKALFNLPRLMVFRSMHAVILSHFKDPRLVQLFDRYATYNGSDPFRAPGTLNVIPHLEHNLGAFFPEKGMGDITDSLVKLAENMKVEFHYKHPVQEILYENRRITGVRTLEGKYPADLVISDTDVFHTYDMMPDLDLPARFRKYEQSTSALIFYWGMEGPLPELELHNIFFSGDYPQEFNSLFRKKTLTPDPTVYVFISSKAVPTDAPPGKQNWFVMINVPENTGQDWENLIRQSRKNILEKLERILETNIESHIAFEDILDPEKIESRTSSHHGSLYGMSSNSRFSAFRRHPNFSRKIKGLYFVGGSVHPGGGIPLCLASAKIVDKLIP